MHLDYILPITITRAFTRQSWQICTFLTFKGPGLNPVFGLIIEHLFTFKSIKKKTKWKRGRDWPFLKESILCGKTVDCFLRKNDWIEIPAKELSKLSQLKSRNFYQSKEGKREGETFIVKNLLVNWVLKLFL